MKAKQMNGRAGDLAASNVVRRRLIPFLAFSWTSLVENGFLPSEALLAMSSPEDVMKVTFEFSCFLVVRVPGRLGRMSD